MAPNAQIQNYLWWLRQRGQVFPVARHMSPRTVTSPEKLRFLVVLEQDFAELPESQRILVERMLTATAFPRGDFVFQTTHEAVATIAAADIEGILCLGSRAFAAISSHSFDDALNALVPLALQKGTILCGIHTTEDMERDPQLKRATWQQLQRFMTAMKKEPRDHSRGS